MKNVIKLLLLYLFVYYPVKEYFGRESMMSLILSIVIFIFLYFIIFKYKKR